MKRNCMLVFIGIIACFAAPVANAKKKTSAWNVTHTQDPITGATSCVVAAYDKVGKWNFSRVGYLYPIVENSSKFGLLVGVSSGGRVRLPTGDILWRVDDAAFRELKASENPPTGNAIGAARTGNEVADKSIADAMALTMSMMATSTVTTGEKAQVMLAEMIAGRGLIFRQANAAPAYGLPSDAANRVGQFTNKGQKPIPLDRSFRDGLAACGIRSPLPAPAPR